MKKADQILIACLMALSLLLLIPLFTSDTQASVAVVKVRNEEVMRIPLTQDGTYTVQGTLGNINIEVKDGSVAVTQENSPNHYCSRQGFVNSPSTPIVCLPNETVVVIEGEDESQDTVIS